VPACIEGPGGGGVPTGRLSWRTCVLIEIATAHFLNEIHSVRLNQCCPYFARRYSRVYSSVRRPRSTLADVVLPVSVAVKVKLSLCVS